MKIRMKIRSKLLLSVIVIASVVFIASIGYLTQKLNTISLKSSFSLADAIAGENANLIKASLASDMGMARTMATSLADFRELSEKERVDNSFRIMKNVATQNPDYLSVWCSWELGYLDSKYKESYGRISLTYYRENGALKKTSEYKNMDGDIIGSNYHSLKTLKKEAVNDPYYYTYPGSNLTVLETSVCVPFLEGDKFVGVMGFDFELGYYQNLVKKIKPFEGSFAMLLSQNASIVAHTNEKLVGLSFDSIHPAENKRFGVLKNVFEGKSFSARFIDSKTNIEYYATFASFPIEKSDNPWTLALFVPTNILLKEANAVTYNSYLVIIIGLLILLIVIWIIAYSITNPLVRTTKVLGNLAKGQIDANNKISVKIGDEIEDIGNSVNTLIDGLSKTVNFANEIGKGNLNVAFSKLSDGDLLGESLLNMRKSLENAKEQEDKRKIEDEKMNWATQGVAKFAEILRQNNDDMSEFSYQIISNIIKYVDANIGGLFLINDDNKSDIFFELASCYAYDRRKFLQKKVELGEGLVGRCAKEGETIYLTEIPKEYIHIVSGLGNETPSSLLIVPLKRNDEVYGVVEIASFNPIEKHVIEFIEKIGESIATTVSNVKINIRTVKLLEESRIKSEELSSQEEEMRQNMEELQATQEESTRKSFETDSLVNALNASSYVLEYDLNGRVIYVNQSYLELTGQKMKDIIGAHHSDNIQMTEKQKREYQELWNALKNGNIRKETNKVKLSGKTYTFIETYSPIFNETHEVIKILKIAHNITDFIADKKEKEK
ncbi:MAG: PAS domain-containing protein [Bacteroidales bacterium]|nr:MAG: PAS domain-containing protein [Bacteroidales bacterium]